MITAGTREATVQAVADLCRRYARPRVLDVGCGDGRLLVALAACIDSGCGIDIGGTAIAEARRAAQRLPQLQFRELAVEALPTSDLGRFDVAVFAGSLEHMRDAGAALRAAASRLHPAGRMLVVAISPRAPHAVLSRWWLRHGRNPVVAHLGADGVARVAAAASLETERVEPLYRGSRRGLLDRTAAPVLAAYDRIGGPTCAVVLRPRSAEVSERAA